jgi:hypothetical protein
MLDSCCCADIREGASRCEQEGERALQAAINAGVVPVVGKRRVDRAGVGGRSVFPFTDQRPVELLSPKNSERRTASRSSLVISKGEWIWNHVGIGDRSALDFLVKVRGMKFNDAVDTDEESFADLVSFSLPGEAPKPEQPLKFTFYPLKFLR